MVQAAETHGISDVKEKGTILLHKFNTRLVPKSISVPGLLVTFILFKPYKSAIIKQEVFFNTCARTNIISSLFGFNVKNTVSHHCLVQQIFTTGVIFLQKKLSTNSSAIWRPFFKEWVVSWGLHNSNRVFVVIRFTEHCQVFKVLLRLTQQHESQAIPGYQSPPNPIISPVELTGILQGHSLRHPVGQNYPRNW